MIILKTAYDKTVAVYDRKKLAGGVRVCGDFKGSWGGMWISARLSESE